MKQVTNLICRLKEIYNKGKWIL